jgi:hypothetical protein
MRAMKDAIWPRSTLRFGPYWFAGMPSGPPTVIGWPISRPAVEMHWIARAKTSVAATSTKFSENGLVQNSAMFCSPGATGPP